jgi:hypothetical protein
MIIPPSDGLVYRLLFAHTAMPVSRLCGAIVSYKSDYEALNRKVRHAVSRPSSFPPWDGFIIDEGAGMQATVAEDLSAQSAQLNSYIWDFAVALWRQKLFASGEDPTTGKLAFRDTLGLSGYARPALDPPMADHTYSIDNVQRDGATAKQPVRSSVLVVHARHCLLQLRPRVHARCRAAVRATHAHSIASRYDQGIVLPYTSTHCAGTDIRCRPRTSSTTSTSSGRGVWRDSTSSCARL